MNDARTATGRLLARARALLAARRAPAAIGFPAAVLFLAASGAAFAAGPQVRFITVTDVTPRSFQVSWLTAGPAEPGLRLFQAPACVDEVQGAGFTPYPSISGDPAIAAAAQARGVLVVKVAGLMPDTEYCVQTVSTSPAGLGVTTAPDPALRVRTARLTTRSRPSGDPPEAAFSNDLVKVAITRSLPGAGTRGALLLLKVRGAASPLSAFVGDAIDDDGDPATSTTLALFDLNNLYDTGTGASLDLLGDGSEDLSARALGGPEGYVTVHARIVPPEGIAAALRTPGVCRGAPATACDGRLGDADGDGALSAADADRIRDFVVGLSAIPACGVCGDATWDFGNDMKDALAIAQAAAGLRTLP
jgi:hypothetical protein